jgi:hypothetical protein
MAVASICFCRSWLLAISVLGISSVVRAPLEAATITYTIDPARSSLMGSGNVRNISLTPQTPGSLRGPISGTLRAQWQDTGLTFSGGSAIVPARHPEGPFVPSAAAVGSGALVDNYGAEGRVFGIRLFSAAIRDAVADIASGRSEYGGPVTDLRFGFVNGTVDYHDEFNDKFDFLDLTEVVLVPNSSTGVLTRSIENKVDTIMLPVFADIPVDFLEPNDSRLTLEGQLVATYPVLTIEANTRTLINSRLNLAGLNIEPGATVRLTGDPLLTLELQMAANPIPGSTLDLSSTTTALVLDYPIGGSPPATEVRQRIIAGRGNTELIGSWDGQGITSSAAQADPSSFSVGWATNGELPLDAYSTFRGQSVDPTTILIRATRIGDANLDGVVDDNDVTVVGATFGTTTGAVWALGDFDYDGDVDDNDVTLVSALYNPGAPPLGASAGASHDGSIAAVPEPAGWVYMALAAFAAGLIGWQRGWRLRR